MRNWLRDSPQVFAASVAQLLRSPASALMGVAAIGVTLALPTLLYVITENIDQFSGSRESQARVNLFLAPDLESPDELRASLQELPGVERIDAISPDQGLAEFKQYSGFARASELLDDNPLPWTLVVQLSREHGSVAAVEAFTEQAAALPGVDSVRSDAVWLRRLATMVEIGHRLVWVLAILLGFAVVVIISNSVRLAILGRAHEIEVIKLIGGTDRFIRRPFLYQGLAQGALGAVLAVLTVTACIEALRAPIMALISDYGSRYQLLGLQWSTAAQLLGVGSGLGWCAARFSVGRHLKDIEPR